MTVVESFYSNVADLQKEIQKADRGMANLLSQFDGSIIKFKKDIDTHHKTLLKSVKSPEMKKFMGDLLQLVGSSFESWQSEKERFLECQKFRNEFNDSLIVIIYGKVKAGKSSLGNFVADLSRKTAKPAFFRYDEAGNQETAKCLEEIDEDAFDVKSTECTTSIQGFRIPGMTWVDTPGLLSMTGQNGDLAKEYIDNADLIIYPMASDSPGRNTDVGEVCELVKKGKEFSVIITKSDRVEEDEVDGELVSVLENKSAEDRRKQEEWTVENLSKGISQELAVSYTSNSLSDIFSISVKVAKESEVGSDQWHGSNVEQFYSMMDKIVKHDARRLKVEQPLKIQKASLKNLISGQDTNSLSSILKNIKSKRSEINKKERQLEEKSHRTKIELLNSVETKVELLVSEAHKQKLSPKEFVSKISTCVDMEVTSGIQELVKDTLGQLVNDFSAAFPIYELSEDELKFEPKYQKISYTNTTVSSGTGKAVGGLIGGALGTFGGPVGIFVGSAVGGYLGGKAGETFSTTKTKSVEIGDNFEDIRLKALSDAELAVDHGVIKSLEDIRQKVFTPVSKALDGLVRDMDKLMMELNQELVK